MPEITQHYDNWKLAYRNLGSDLRALESNKTQTKNISIIQDCHKLALILSNSFNVWLESADFRPIKEGFLKYLQPSEEIRVVIQSENIQLQQLPWHLWKLIEQDYLRAEISFSPVEYAPIVIQSRQSTQQLVKMLVILGESSDIKVQKDLQLLQQYFSDAEIFTLINPHIEQLSDSLWEQNWDILFFAGHSNSHFDSGQGRFYINERESLTIDELKFALRNAIAHGLKLAIFNSCDGLLLAQQLKDLSLAASIVMGERIPDEVAQRFLEYFLKPFREGGKSLYLCLRKARERLQALEPKYPCASWLPVICSHPAAETISWQMLGGISPCPYQGLAAFQEEHTSVFFGREAFTSQLVEAVKIKKLVTVIAPSGSGKSSVIFAGLIPRLRCQKSFDESLKIASFRPGSHAFDALAAVLVSVDSSGCSDSSLDSTSADKGLIELQLAQQLQHRSNALSQIIENIISGDNQGGLLLVIDQFEELYTLVPEAERLLFLDALLSAVNNTVGFTLLLTLRADFCGKMLDYQPFGEVLQQYPPELLIPMSRQELSKAIALPAQLRGVSLESGLIERIINDVNQQPGKFP